jgi:hypothetical protein
MKCFIVAVTFTQAGTDVGATSLGMRVCRQPETASASVAAEFVAGHGRGWEMQTVTVVEVALDLIEKAAELIRSAKPPPGPQGVVPMTPRLVDAAGKQLENFQSLINKLGPPPGTPEPAA